jgi:hypothetical protein
MPISWKNLNEHVQTPLMVAVAGSVGGAVSPVFKALLDRQAALISAPWAWPDAILPCALVGAIAGFLGAYLLADTSAAKFRLTAIALASGLFWQPILGRVGSFLPGTGAPQLQAASEKIEQASAQTERAVAAVPAPTTNAPLEPAEDKLGSAIEKTMAALIAARAVDQPFLKYQAATTGLTLVEGTREVEAEPARSGLDLIKKESDALLTTLGTAPPATTDPPPGQQEPKPDGLSP